MQCLAMAGLTVDKNGMVFGIISEGSLNQRHFIRMVAQVNGDAEQNVKRVAEGLPGGRVVASMSSATGIGGRRRVRTLMGIATRGKGTTVGDGGDGLARRSKGRRIIRCHLRMVNTSGRGGGSDQGRSGRCGRRCGDIGSGGGVPERRESDWPPARAPRRESAAGARS